MLNTILFISLLVPVLSDNRIYNVTHHINKCCRNGMGMNATEIPENCVNLKTDLFNGEEKEIYNLNMSIKTVNLSEEFNVTYTEPRCDRYIIPEFKIQQNGSLYVDTNNIDAPYIIFSPEQYCVDTFDVHTQDGKDDGIKWRALLCSIEKDESQYELSSSCMLVSCFFILLTVGVYAWLPELRNLHGMVLIAYLLSFFVSFLFLAVLKINALIRNLPALYCYISSFIIYFSLLAAFFWLNVMCYDIWRTFSAMRGQQTGTSVSARFRMYCAYAFGTPALLTALVVGLEFSNLEHELLPNLRRNGCFFFNIGLILYLYGPIAALWMVNLIFFVLTSVNIWKIKRETKKTMNTADSSKNNSCKMDEQRFMIYLKLYAVMGLTWILEIVSYFYDKYNTIWQFTDAYNVLVGLIIFIIFVCKKNTLRMLKNRYRLMRGLPSSEANTNTSSSSRTLASQSRDSVINMNSLKKGMLVSCFFILLTVGVYAWLPELRNLHGMVLMAYLLNFFVSFCFLASLQIMVLINKLRALYCLVASFIIYFSILAAFFWINVMCYDIWRTFSGKRGQQVMGKVRSCFLVYCAYALGTPTLLTVLLAGLEFADLPYHPLLPLLRRKRCFLFGMLITNLNSKFNNS